MQMKYFQGIWDIKQHYEAILQYYNMPLGTSILETWELSLKDKEDIVEEYDALNYLLACKLEVAHDKNAIKPSLEVANRCFERHVSFLEKIHNCQSDGLKIHPNQSVQKQYKTCCHYLFQFSLPAWYEKLPNEVLTFENKYPDFDEL